MSILNKIATSKKEEVELLKQHNIYNKLNNIRYKEISFYDALSKKNKINLIAEVKKASPSKGIIRENFNHLKIAKEYEDNNVDAISVLTDKKFFMGDENYLQDIAKTKKVPLLRKDFIIDEVQIYQAKLIGADAILLICEILDKYQIKDFAMLAKELKMDVLTELHSINQLDKLDFYINNIIGINNRNLEDFEVNIKTTGLVKKYLPNDVLVVSESGISNKNDVEYLKSLNVNAVLVGESFMRQENIGNSVKNFVELLRYES